MRSGPFLSWLLLSLGPLLAHAKPLSCADVYQRLFQVERANDSRFLATLTPEKKLELDRIDQILKSELDQELARLPQKKAETILKKIRDAQKMTHFGEEAGGLQRSEMGMLRGEPRREKDFLIQDRILQHPLGRIVVRHEFEHMIQEQERFKFFGRFARRLNKIKNEERGATRSEYRFIRKIYKPDDLARLKAEFPTEIPDDDWTLLEQNGILVDGLIMPFSTTIKTLKAKPELWNPLTRTFERELNGYFIRMVEKALTLDEDQYLKAAYTASYREANREANIELLVSRFATVGGTVSAALFAKGIYGSYQVDKKIEALHQQRLQSIRNPSNMPGRETESPAQEDLNQNAPEESNP